MPEPRYSDADLAQAIIDGERTGSAWYFDQQAAMKVLLDLRDARVAMTGAALAAKLLADDLKVAEHIIVRTRGELHRIANALVPQPGGA